MSIDLDLARVRLAGVDPQPRLGPVERRGGDRRARPSPSTSPVEASTPLTGRRPRSRGARAALIASITASAGSRGAPVEAGAEQRVDDHVRLLEPAGVERRPAAGPGGALSCACASSPIHSGGQTASTSTSRPACAQQPRGDEPVAAVVALAADDRDPPGRRALADRAREPLARALHQLGARGCPWSSIAHASVARISSASGSGSSQRGGVTAPPRRQRPPWRACGSCEIVHRAAELGCAAPPRAPESRTSGAPSPSRTHLDVVRVPDLERERLHDRLLGAEAGREVHDRPRPAVPRTPARCQ